MTSSSGIDRCLCANHHGNRQSCNGVQTNHNTQICKHSVNGPACNFYDHCRATYRAQRTNCNSQEDCTYQANNECRLKCSKLKSSECCNGFGAHCEWSVTFCRMKCSAMDRETCGSAHHCTWTS